MHGKRTSFVLAAALATGVQGHAQSTLASLRDHKRVLLVFGAGDFRLEDQWKILAVERNEVAQRDLVTVLITEVPAATQNGEGPARAFFSAAEQHAARTRFHVPKNEFTVILIGKDGGEKLRSNKPISWQNLQSTIDAMPMRQAEASRSR